MRVKDEKSSLSGGGYVFTEGLDIEVKTKEGTPGLGM